MASVAQLAKMYRERIPTSPTETTGKVGPRKTTAADVRRVATYGRAGMRPTPSTITPQPRASAFQLAPAQAQTITTELIGGPGFGYGEKYGGFATQSDFQNAIRGEAIGTRELADLARMQAEEAIGTRLGTLAPQLTAELSRSASMAGVRPGALVSEADRAKFAGGYEDVQKFGRTPEYLEARGPWRFVEGKQPGSPDANALMRAAYENMLYSPEFAPEDQRRVADIAAQQNVALPGTQEYANFLVGPEVSGRQQIADIIEQTPLSEYARQIATARYGMDPNLAAGLFTPQMDIEYEKERADYDRMLRGFMPTTTAEYIFDNYGAEAYDQYKRNVADAALYGSPSEQRAALNAQIDIENNENDQTIAANYGFRPSDIPGYDADTVRQAFFDPNFQSAVKQAVEGFQSGGLSQEDGDKLIRAYLDASADSLSAPLNAQILAEIIATFNTEYFDFLG